MKTRIPKRTYTAQFREAAVRQVIELGRTATDVSRSLDISPKTLGNWVSRARRDNPRVRRTAAVEGRWGTGRTDNGGVDPHQFGSDERRENDDNQRPALAAKRAIGKGRPASGCRPKRSLWLHWDYVGNTSDFSRWSVRVSCIPPIARSETVATAS
jgi:transposase-like protein